MKILTYGETQLFVIQCNCGFTTTACCTLEAAGREADLHMARMFPLPSERRPCDLKEESAK
jgi:hypothetical protein